MVLSTGEMGRVDSAIAGVQERDKWLRRLDALERALGEVLERRRHLENRLRRVRKELQKLELTDREFVAIHGRVPTFEVSGAPHGPFLR